MIYEPSYTFISSTEETAGVAYRTIILPVNARLRMIFSQMGGADFRKVVIELCDIAKNNTDVAEMELIRAIETPTYKPRWEGDLRLTGNVRKIRLTAYGPNTGEFLNLKVMYE